MVFISKRKAGIDACKLTTNDIRELLDRPNMDFMDVLRWHEGFGDYIESGYNGRQSTMKGIAEEFTANINRKFKKADGKIISYCWVMQEYISFMCRTAHSGREYTVKAFKNFINTNYTEVFE